MTEAIQYLHEQGIVHRDLKVKLRCIDYEVASGASAREHTELRNGFMIASAQNSLLQICIYINDE